jgi:hypothetical protein
MAKPLFTKCRRFFPDLPEHIFRNLLLVCSAIVLARSTNLNVLKDYLPQLLDNDQTKVDSHYKRLIRFFRLATPNRLVICILQFVFRLFQSRFTHLILDATTWRVGKKPIHLLTLCILYRDTAIPIYWVQLNKKGHSSEVERQKLMTEALGYYRLQGKILLADREYIGEKWLRYLCLEGIDFVIRLSEGCYRLAISAAPGPAYSKLTRQAYHRKRGVIKGFILNGCAMSIVMLKNPKNDSDEPLLYFISSLTHKIKITEAYRRRWRIETCFKHLKTQGFNLEDLNFKDDGKIMLLVAIVIMAYVLSLQEAFRNGSSKQKVYRNGSRSMAVSFFRQGISGLRGHVQSLAMFIGYLEAIAQRLLTPQWMYVQ